MFPAIAKHLWLIATFQHDASGLPQSRNGVYWFIFCLYACASAVTIGLLGIVDLDRIASPATTFFAFLLFLLAMACFTRLVPPSLAAIFLLSVVAGDIPRSVAYSLVEQLESPLMTLVEIYCIAITLYAVHTCARKMRENSKSGTQH